MNQQFMQQQSYGPPPAGVAPLIQNYSATSKISPVPSGPGLPSQSPSGFQTVPLGPIPPQQSCIEPQQITNKFMPPANNRPPASQLPPGQLPHPFVAQANNQSNNNYRQTQNGAAQQQPEQNSPNKNSAHLTDVKMLGASLAGPVRAINSPRQQLQDGALPPPPMSQANMAPGVSMPLGGVNVSQARAGPNFPSQAFSSKPGPVQAEHMPFGVPQFPGDPQGMPPPPSPPISGQPPTLTSSISGPTPGPPIQFENGPAPTPQTTQSIFAASPQPPQQSIPDAGPPPMFAQPPQQRRPPVPGQHQQTPPMPTGQLVMATGQPPMAAGQLAMPTRQPPMSTGQPMPTGQPPMSIQQQQSSQMPHGLPSGLSRVVPISAGHQFGAAQLSGIPPPVLGGGGAAPPPISSVGGPPRGGMAPIPSMKQSGGPGMAGPQMQQGFNQPPPHDSLSGPMQNINLSGPPQGPPRQYPQQPPNINGTPMTVSGPSISGLPHMPPQMQPPPPPLQGGPNYHMNGGQHQQPLPGASGYHPQQQGQGAPMTQPHQQQYAGGVPPLSGQGRPPGAMPPQAGGGGYPQQPQGGYPQQPQGGYPGVQQQAPGMGYLQQQQKRLDPDQMPSQIQVTEDDQSLRSGKFYANQKGLVPPLVTTTFTAMDQGYASPRFIRSTMYNVPVSNDLMKQTSVPFALVISPMARTMPGEYTPPCVDFGALGPVRCIRCKAYMGPYMQFIDSGRRFVCVFCRASTEVPTEYFQHLDHTGMRMDRMERPELVLGTYELTATVDYCRNNTFPKPPAFIFVVDVSYNSIKSGLVHLICAEMKQILKNFPIDQGQDRSRMRVGFITYDRDVHFYNIKGNLAAPQMLVVGDTHEMFMPLLDGFLCTPEESEAVIDSLMEQIPNMFVETKECETILLPAITAGLEALKASECVGKLLVFHSTLPTAEAPGKLKNRDERKLLGTDKERTVLTPQSTVYNQLGQDCVAAGCSVDLYLFNNAYIDIATIGQVARLTGGEVFKYTYFQADLDGTRLLNDVITNISRPIAFDSIMRVRTSTGVRPTDFYGHFFMSNTTDIELAAVDSDKAIAVEIKHDDKLSEEDGVYVQVAVLYTSCSGIRRLRIINQALKTCSQMSDLYRSCDLDTIVNFFGKQSVWKLMENNPKVVKDAVINRAAQMLANYRKNCANPSSAGQLILPECMKLLPLYVNCLLKSDAISGGADMTLDDRSFVMQAVMTMDVPTSVNYFYPRLLPLHEMTVNENGEMVVPGSIRCSIAKLTDQGVYILENGIHMFMWIGLAAYQDFIQQVFGVPSAVQVNTETAELPQLDNPYSKAVHSLINNIRQQRHRYMRLTLVRQREKLEPVFRHFLVEDQGHDNTASYVDFLCHMHKEIRAMLS